MKQSLEAKMEQLLIAAMILLPVWWILLTIAYVLDYFRQRKEAKSRPPLSDELKAEIARIEAERPRKLFATPTWADFHPKRYPMYLLGLLLYVPYIVLFLPVSILSPMLSWEFKRR